MTLAHNLGFPRIGHQRRLKRALEAYWAGDVSREQLLTTGRDLRAEHWAWQTQAGLDLVPVADFSWYDHVLDTSLLMGCVPTRFAVAAQGHELDLYFCMARGRAPGGAHAQACEMTKWFDTNYHYLVPEFEAEQTFTLDPRYVETFLLGPVREALALGYKPKPVLLGPLSFLWLGKSKHGGDAKLALLEPLAAVYQQLLAALAELGVTWVQLDEPILALDLPVPWRAAFEEAYYRLHAPGLKRLLATYFGPLLENTSLACRLPVDGLHVDLVRAPEQLSSILGWLPNYKVLSLGVVDGRNVWRSDLDAALALLQEVKAQRGDLLWVAPSCSLLHLPLDVQAETGLDVRLKSWLAFARQRVQEVVDLRRALDEGPDAVAAAFAAARAALADRHTAQDLSKPAVQARTARVRTAMGRRRSAYPVRRAAQAERLRLPLLPTTTIGSLPQTQAIRLARRNYRAGVLTEADYLQAMRQAIAEGVRRQEEAGLDVLVHGEPERTDMVEYFGGLLEGFALTEHAWVQSYGSRCVKPPILYADVQRRRPMTVGWSRYAQSLTRRPMKAMLTGPVTMLQWSFVRNDQPRSRTCLQIALALRDEVLDLEAAGIPIIQIDEPALREGLPLRRQAQARYLDWAVQSFRLTAGGVRDDTQIHTHMCYAEFDDILDAIVALDADVITLETARSDMELLNTFAEFEYPNDIGPGVFDIHSPNVPDVDELVQRIRRAAGRIPLERLWINPDCGLKTRDWPTVQQALRHMVTAARRARPASAVANSR